MLKSILKNLRSTVGRYVGDTRGVTVLAFSMAVPVVVGAMGMSVDLARSYLARERLTHALDAAALAAAASSQLTDDQIRERANLFFYKNFPYDSVGHPTTPVVELTNDTVRVTAAVSLDTTFLKVLGVSEVSVGNGVQVNRQVSGVEVALVLDVTGSMSSNNNIGTLRTAATNFVNILCPVDSDDPSTNSYCSSSVRIGIVPFSASVNVGPYGLGKTPSGGFYDSSFVNNPNNLTFNQSNSTKWWGCILEQAPPNDTKNSQASWRWDMYRYVSAYGSTSAPNTNCNKAYIHPLSDNKVTLKSRISSLTASGNTLSNVGMVWGYRVLSPEFPFREGSPFGDPQIKKVAILMTDGDNYIGARYSNGVPVSGTYSAYGPWTTYRYTDHDLDVKLAATCENMKNDGIRIYTITFTSGISNDTKSYFRNCASDENKYYDAPAQADLVDAFNQIARELSNIYISQ